MSDTPETPKQPPPATWSFIVDPKKPGHSLVLYKGEPVPDILQAAVSLEAIPVPVNDKGEQRLTMMSVITLKIMTPSLALGTYDAPVPAPKEPVQQELPLGTP